MTDKINNLGQSVLGELAKDSMEEIAGDCHFSSDSTPVLSHDMAHDSVNSASGAVISPTPELGQSAYQMPTVPDGKKPS